MIKTPIPDTLRRMDRNTINTTFGFLGTMLRKYTGFGLRGRGLNSIYNYRRINERLHSSGQPTARQFAAIRDAGFHHVVNLAPHGVENALADEADLLSALNIAYTHIPVDFKDPTARDFAEFADIMGQSGDDPIWIHCAANMRVSAFIYKYRRDILGEDEAVARADLYAIWEPFGIWKKFIAMPSAPE